MSGLMKLSGTKPTHRQCRRMENSAMNVALLIPVRTPKIICGKYLLLDRDKEAALLPYGYALTIITSAYS